MTLDSTIVVAIISLISAIVVCLINNIFSQKALASQSSKQMEEMLRQQNAQAQDMIAHNEESIAIMQCSVDEVKREITRLHAEMEKHNKVIERTYQLENDMAVVKEKVSVANKRIADLESKN